MKQINLLLVLGFLYFMVIQLNAQNVHIPDANFKTYLLGNTTINTNGDGEIQISEASAFTGTISCAFRNISDLTGIGAFTNLTQLNCSSNELTSLDISQNTSLTKFFCVGNDLTSLDVSQNINLIEFFCGVNDLTSLDVSQNVNLLVLRCENNKLINIDLSLNTALVILECGGNDLTSLDLRLNTNLRRLYVDENQLVSLNVKNGNNVNFLDFNAIHNPNLICIEVDDSTYSASNWNYIDSTASFSADCSLFSSVNTMDRSAQLTVYPNPTQNLLYIQQKNTVQDLQITITDQLGRILQTMDSQTDQTVLDLNHWTNGMYYIIIHSSEGTIVQKIIKQ